jgi:hypothetical protein
MRAVFEPLCCCCCVRARGADAGERASKEPTMCRLAAAPNWEQEQMFSPLCVHVLGSVCVHVRACVHVLGSVCVHWSICHVLGAHKLFL